MSDLYDGHEAEFWEKWLNHPEAVTQFLMWEHELAQPDYYTYFLEEVAP
jgi:hypothetical protein